MDDACVKRVIRTKIFNKSMFVTVREEDTTNFEAYIEAGNFRILFIVRCMIIF